MAGGNGFTLKVVPEKLEAKADEVSSLVKDVEKAFQVIQTSMDGTKRYWMGEAGEKHRNMFMEKKEEITEVLERLREHPVDLLRMAGVYRNAEQANTSIAQTLQSDIII